MRLLRLHAENFRNIPLAALEFLKDSTFLVGRNGQGKTNLLEAAGMVTALRSFRTTDTRALIRHGEKQARLFLVCEREGERPNEITLTLARGSKQISCDGERVSRLADFLGRFPTVTLSSEDIQLIRGGPALRRRFIDITLSATNPAYFKALRDYHRALKDRNLLLKAGQAREPELAAFDKAIAPAAVTVCHLRQAGLDALSQHFSQAYQRISVSSEQAVLYYRPESDLTDEAEILRLLKDSRAADLAYKSTQHGPHRDDLALKVNDRPAREFASEGQQRTLVISLRLAQMAAYEAYAKVAPVILADDVLGELDPVRRGRFWEAVGETRQVIASGTEPPPAGERDWDMLRVADGTFNREAP